MTTRAAIALFVVCCVGAVGARQQTIFRTTVDLVSVTVSVKRGKIPVAGLTSADFVVLDNGITQDVDAVTVESVPLDVTLVIDASDSVTGRIFQRFQDAVGDTARLLTERDRLRVIAFSHALKTLSAFTSGGRAPVWTDFSARGGTSAFDALVAAMITARPPERRHIIIALTDGRDTTSIFDARTARDVALRSDAVVHVALAWQRPRFPEAVLDSLPPPSSFEEVAAATGGTTLGFNVADSISTLFKAFIDDFRAGYVLRYTAKGVDRGGWHELTVTVNTPGDYVVRARKGYGSSQGDAPTRSR